MPILLALLALQDPVPPSYRWQPLQADDRLTLTAVEPLTPRRPGLRRLRVLGRARLGGEAVLHMAAFPIRERLSGGRIGREKEAAEGFLAQVKDGTFAFDDLPVDAARWELAITAPAGFQNPRSREQNKAFATEAWRFEVYTANIFGALAPAESLDGVVGRLETARRQVLELAFTAASGSEELWRERSAALAEALRKSRVVPRGVLLRAAERERSGITETLVTAHGRLVWQGGQVMLAQPPGLGPLLTHRGEPFSYERLLDYVTEAEEAAGRELLLLAVEDARRGALGPVHAKALAKAREIPGVASFVDRLVPDADLDALERDLRGLKRR